MGLLSRPIRRNPGAEGRWTGGSSAKKQTCGRTEGVNGKSGRKEGIQVNAAFAKHIWSQFCFCLCVLLEGRGVEPLLLCL